MGTYCSAAAMATTACGLAVVDERLFRFLVESTPGFVWFVLRKMAQWPRATNAAL